MKSILITGARAGIGLDVAQQLLQRGHTVYATVHLQASVAPLKAKLASFGDRAIVEKLDILDEEDRKKVMNWNIDVLINNAAIGDSGPLDTIPAQRMRDVFETNVIATLQLTQQVLQQMKSQQRGQVIFMSSLAGMLPTPYISPYSFTKYAIEGLASALRGEVKSFGIHVTVINPGGYNTGFNKKNMQKKYEWLDTAKLDPVQLKEIKKEEAILNKFEMQSTKSITKKIVKAVEAKSPHRRYFAPWWQGLGVFFIRLF